MPSQGETRAPAFSALASMYQGFLFLLFKLCHSVMGWHKSFVNPVLLSFLRTSSGREFGGFANRWALLSCGVGLYNILESCPWLMSIEKKARGLSAWFWFMYSMLFMLDIILDQSLAMFGFKFDQGLLSKRLPYHYYALQTRIYFHSSIMRAT